MQDAVHYLSDEMPSFAFTYLDSPGEAQVFGIYKNVVYPTITACPPLCQG